jgi:hypothetical protein
MIKPHMLQEFKRRLNIIFESEWDDRRPTNWLVEDGKRGTKIIFQCKKNDETWVTVLEKEIVKLENLDDVEKQLSEALSLFLMGHYRWPR